MIGMNDSAKPDKKAAMFLLVLALGVQLMVYVPYVGTGFVTDDFEWIRNTVVNGKVDYLRPFTVTTGFYRPLVSLTFGLQYQLHGMNPRPYGWFNLGLHMVNILLVFLLLSSYDATKSYAPVVTLLFSLNPKGTSMAVGWISGRTSLLFGFFMLLSLYLLLKQRLYSSKNEKLFKRILRYFLAGIAYFAALLSKETAAAAPIFILFLMLFIYKHPEAAMDLSTTFKKIKAAFMAMLVFIIPLVIYCFLRRMSNAFSLFNAPDFYRYVFSPLSILRNLSEYLTRAGILDIYLLVFLGAFYLSVKKWTADTSPSLPTPPGTIPGNKTVLWLGIAWFLNFLLPVLLLPVRSDIYVYIPQVGIHVMFLVILFPLWQKTISTLKIRKYVLISLAFLLLTWTGYLFIKAGGYGKAGDASTDFTRQVIPALSKIETGSRVFIIDMNPGQRFAPIVTISYGFASLLDLYYPQKRLSGEIITPSQKQKLKGGSGPLYVFAWEKGKNVRLLQLDMY